MESESETLSMEQSLSLLMEKSLPQINKSFGVIESIGILFIFIKLESK